MSSTPRTSGRGFNEDGGGVFVALWEEAGISICEWLAHSIPFRRPPYCSTSVWEPRLWLTDNSAVGRRRTNPLGIFKRWDTPEDIYDRRSIPQPKSWRLPEARFAASGCDPFSEFPWFAGSVCVARVLAVVWSADVSFGGGVWADLGIWGGIEHFTQMQMIFGEFFVCVVDGMAWGKSASCVVFPVEGEGLIMIVFFCAVRRLGWGYGMR